uniref:Zinc finger C2H2 LYAR-type domain-containing protein n=1 Tax=Cannabis sativa TaxID=3483 RepID=A0A803QT98_CANSA
MVWFQCEDCGDNLKKPKLPSHFRVCCATKLSCIDCGKVFGQESVLGHTQCMTEMEKYGPKGQGQGKGTNGSAAKPNKDGKQQPDFDISVGLSERPPWFCRRKEAQSKSPGFPCCTAETEQDRRICSRNKATVGKPSKR